MATTAMNKINENGDLMQRLHDALPIYDKCYPGDMRARMALSGCIDVVTGIVGESARVTYQALARNASEDAIHDAGLHKNTAPLRSMQCLAASCVASAIAYALNPTPLPNEISDRLDSAEQFERERKDALNAKATPTIDRLVSELTLLGFDDDDPIDGADVVDVISEHWELIKSLPELAAQVAGKSDAEIILSTSIPTQQENAQ